MRIKNFLFLWIALSLVPSSFGQLSFFSTNENVIAQSANLESYVPDKIVHEDSLTGKITVRDPRAAVFPFQNPYTQGKLFIEEIKTSSPDLIIINPPSTLLPGESGELVAFWKGRKEVTSTNISIQIRSKIQIELENRTVQTLSVQIQTNQINNQIKKG